MIASLLAVLLRLARKAVLLVFFCVALARCFCLTTHRLDAAAVSTPVNSVPGRFHGDAMSPGLAGKLPGLDVVKNINTFVRDGEL